MSDVAGGEQIKCLRCQTFHRFSFFNEGGGRGGGVEASSRDRRTIAGGGGGEPNPSAHLWNLVRTSNPPPNPPRCSHSCRNHCLCLSNALGSPRTPGADRTAADLRTHTSTPAQQLLGFYQTWQTQKSKSRISTI